MENNTTGTKRPRILCVDDDELVLTFLEAVLQLNGYSVVTATNAQGALKTFASEAVDAVVLDYEMPAMNGAKLARAMKEINPQVPKLLFTSYRTLPEDAAKLIEGFCSKCDGAQPLLTWLKNVVARVDQATKGAVSLNAHIAIARLAPEWEPQSHVPLAGD
jgi:CheY-like chemotaxis protein